MFAPGYELMPLNELESYINEYMHLPNVPSAEEAIQNGIKLTNFSMRLLEKLEELTLYAIQQQKTVEELEARLRALESNLYE